MSTRAISNRLKSVATVMACVTCLLSSGCKSTPPAAQPSPSARAAAPPSAGPVGATPGAAPTTASRPAPSTAASGGSVAVDKVPVVQPTKLSAFVEQREGLNKYSKMLERVREVPGRRDRILEKVRVDMETFKVPDVNKRLAIIGQLFDTVQKMSDKEFAQNQKRLAGRLRNLIGVAWAKTGKTGATPFDLGQ